MAYGQNVIGKVYEFCFFRVFGKGLRLVEEELGTDFGKGDAEGLAATRRFRIMLS